MNGDDELCINDDTRLRDIQDDPSRLDLSNTSDHIIDCLYPSGAVGDLIRFRELISRDLGNASSGATPAAEHTQALGNSVQSATLARYSRRAQRALKKNLLKGRHLHIIEELRPRDER